MDLFEIFLIPLFFSLELCGNSLSNPPFHGAISTLVFFPRSLSLPILLQTRSQGWISHLTSPIAVVYSRAKDCVEIAGKKRFSILALRFYLFFLFFGKHEFTSFSPIFRNYYYYGGVMCEGKKWSRRRRQIAHSD